MKIKTYVDKIKKLKAANTKLLTALIASDEAREKAERYADKWMRIVADRPDSAPECQPRAIVIRRA